jgi:hypothetical protein
MEALRGSSNSVSHIAQDLRGHTCYDRPIRNVSGYHRAGTHERTLSDRDAA